MAAETYTTISPALAQLFSDQVKSQINRSCVLAQLLQAKKVAGKNVAWDAKFGTATPTGAVIADGGDVSVYNSDVKVPAVLNFGTYHDAFSVTGKAMAAAYSTGNPSELTNLVMSELADSATRLARAIASDIYVGSGATNYIHGLLASGAPAIGPTGVYATIDPATYTQWAGTSINAATDEYGDEISFDHLRKLRRLIYTATSGTRIDMFVCDPIQFEKLGKLFDDNRRFTSDVRVGGQSLTLAGGFRTLEFDGIPVIEDVLCPAGHILGLSSADIELCQMPFAPPVTKDMMGNAQLAGSPEEQFGTRQMGLEAEVMQLARTGNATRIALYVYPQLKVTRRNAHGYIYNLV